METRRLGRSDLQVPVFALGTGNFGGKGGVYANAYAGGASEETLEATVTPAQRTALDMASRLPLPYPPWHQAAFPERNPPPL